MKTHTVKGCEILAGLDRLQDREYLEYAYNICRTITNAGTAGDIRTG